MRMTPYRQWHFKTEEEAQRFVYDAATKLAAFANEEKPDVDIPDA
jgi:hypothetical protein